MQDKVLKGIISTTYISTLEQLTDTFTKNLIENFYDLLHGKLCMINIYALNWRGVWRDMFFVYLFYFCFWTLYSLVNHLFSFLYRALLYFFSFPLILYSQIHCLKRHIIWITNTSIISALIVIINSDDIWS